MKLPKTLKPAQAAIGIGLLLLVGGLGWWFVGAGAAPPPPPRVIAVATGKAAIKDLPYRVEAPGSVQPVVSVAIRARVDSQVDKVLFEDGAAVKTGDLLFKLDARAIDAMVEQAEATLARDSASLVKAKRDVERFTGLVAKGTTAKVTLDDAQTTADMLAATVKQDQANLDNLRAQRSYYDILSPARWCAPPIPARRSRSSTRCRRSTSPSACPSATSRICARRAATPRSRRPCKAAA